MAHVGKGISGSFSGAATGASVGSSFGPQGTVIGAGIGQTVGFLSGIFGGHDDKNDAILKQILSQLRTTGGATARQNQAILGQSLAGGSRLQAQSATARQLNRDTEATFNAEQRAIRQFLGTQIQRDRLQAEQDQQSRGMLSQIGNLLGTFKQGGIKGKGGVKGKTNNQSASTSGLEIKDVIQLMQLFQQGGVSNQIGGAAPLNLNSLVPKTI